MDAYLRNATMSLIKTTINKERDASSIDFLCLKLNKILKIGRTISAPINSELLLDEIYTNRSDPPIISNAPNSRPIMVFIIYFIHKSY